MDAAEAARQDSFLAEYTVAELLRNGITTFLEVGSPLPMQEQLREQAARLGLRAYLGPGYESARWIPDEAGRPRRQTDEEAGRRAFEAACQFISDLATGPDRRVRGILAPRQVESCSVELLNATRDAAHELGVPITAHLAYGVTEFMDIVREHRLTPVERLATLGMLGPNLIVGHGNLPAENYSFFSGGRDIALMGEHRVSVAHCPVNIVRRARTLDSWQRYRDAGVNLCLGTDTYPRDMILQMRTASYMGKVAGADLTHASAAEVFSAATLGGARALGRADLGRLAAGCKADVVIIDLTGGHTLRYGPVRDPIKSLVECGIGDDVETVIVDGSVIMEGGRIEGVDLDGLRYRAQQSADRTWAHLQDWDPLERSADDMSPWSFPLRG